MRVRTTYYGPTDTRGSRIVVHFDDRQRTVSYDYAAVDPHESAVCEALRHAGLEFGPVTPTGRTSRGYRFLVAVGGAA